MKIPVLAWIGGLSSIATVVVGIVRYRKVRQEMKVLVWFFILSLVVDIVTLVLTLNGVNNHLVYHMRTPIEYIVLAYALSCWQRTPGRTKIVLSSILLYLTIWVIAKFSLEDLHYFDNFSRSVSSLFLVLLFSRMLYELFRDRLEGILQDFRFWVVCAVLLIHATGVVLFATSNVVMNMPFEKMEILWKLHWSASIVASVCYIRALTCRQDP